VGARHGVPGRRARATDPRARLVQNLARHHAAIPENGSDQPFAKPRTGTISGTPQELIDESLSVGVSVLRLDLHLPVCAPVRRAWSSPVLSLRHVADAGRRTFRGMVRRSPRPSFVSIVSYGRHSYDRPDFRVEAGIEEERKRHALALLGCAPDVGWSGRARRSCGRAMSPMCR
jgi:hypothetical protein